MKPTTRLLAATLAGLALPLAVGTAMLASRMPWTPAPVNVPDVAERPAPPALRHDHLAVVLFGNGGTEITDALAPVERTTCASSSTETS